MTFGPGFCGSIFFLRLWLQDEVLRGQRFPLELGPAGRGVRDSQQADEAGLGQGERGKASSDASGLPIDRTDRGDCCVLPLEICFTYNVKYAVGAALTFCVMASACAYQGTHGYDT